MSDPGSRPRLFDDIERTRRGPAKRTERSFDYLNVSARADVARVRGVLEDWFTRYPRQHLMDLRQRFRGGDIDHLSAVFELFLHELFLRLKLSVAVHPELPGSSRRPDFRVEQPDGRAAYVEATLARGSTAHLTSPPIEAAVLDALDQVETGGFWLWVNSKGAMETYPRIREMKAAVEEWLRTLDWTTAHNSIDPSDESTMPRTTLSHEGWTAEIRAFPRSSPHVPGRAVGIGPMKAGWEDSRRPIYTAVRAKAKRYGRTDLPLIVAVNVLLLGVDRIDEMEALFGKESYSFNPTRPDQPARFHRQPDGIWIGRGGPRNTRVDAVMVFRQLHPSSVGSAPVCTYLNPYSSSDRVPEALLQLGYAKADDDHMTWVDGTPLSEILDLRPGWPGPEGALSTS